MQAQNKMEKVRQRGFKCTHCHSTYMIAGDIAVPVDCTECGQKGTLVKTWDQTVTTTVTVTVTVIPT